MLALAHMAAGCLKRAFGLARPLAGFVSSSGSGSAATPLWGTLPLARTFLSCNQELSAPRLPSCDYSFGFALERGFVSSASPGQELDWRLQGAIDASTLDGLRSIILEHGANFRFSHFSSVFRRISALQASGFDCVEVLRRLGSCIHHALLRKSLDVVSLVTILYSLATLRMAHRELVQRAMGSQLRAGSRSHPSFIDRLAQALTELGFDRANSHSVSNCMWSVAKLGYQHDALMQMCMQRALALRFADFNAHALSNCLYAAATSEFDYGSQGAYKLMGDFICDCMTACRRLGFQQFTDQGLINTFWAVATLSYKAQDMLPVDFIQDFADAWLTYVAHWGLHNFSEQGISNIFVALFKLSHYHAKFLAQLKSHAMENRLPQFTTQALTNVIHGLAIFWALSNDFVLAWSRCVDDSSAQNFTAQSATVSLWSLAVWHTMVSVGALPPADRGTLEAAGRAVSVLFRRFLYLYDTDRSSIKHEMLTQIHQVMDRVPQGEQLRVMRPAVSRACFEAACDNPDTPSGFQDQVFKFLKAMGHEVSQEVKTPDGVMTVDIVLRTSNGRRIAIEVDGPSHFSSNKPYRLNGPSHMRNALLQQRGFDHVLSLPFYEWENDQQARECLTLALRSAGVAV